jgi:hypothetical protein
MLSVTNAPIPTLSSPLQILQGEGHDQDINNQLPFQNKRNSIGAQEKKKKKQKASAKWHTIISMKIQPWKAASRGN